MCKVTGLPLYLIHSYKKRRIKLGNSPNSSNLGGGSSERHNSGSIELLQRRIECIKSQI